MEEQTNIQKKKHFKKMLRLGKLRLYATWNYRLRNSQLRDNEKRNMFIARKCELFNNRGGRCQMCGKVIDKKRLLQMHHILPWWRFPQFETDERNLLLLCADCHNHIHQDPFLQCKTITATAKELGVKVEDYFEV